MKPQPAPPSWRLWLFLTHQERLLVLAILLLILTGLTARYLHLTRQSPEPPPAASVDAEARSANT